MILPFICFLVCHTGPATHFATFASYLRSQGYPVEVLASGPALKKLQSLQLEVTDFNPEAKEMDSSLAQEVAQKCVRYDLVITDMGHLFMKDVHTSLSLKNIKHYAYYDNPEAWVPGGYMEVAAQVAFQAQKVLFANYHLASRALFGSKPSCPIGYYPFRQAEKIAEERKIRKANPKKVLAYFGGNNEEYFTHAFPQFLDILEKVNLPDTKLILHQHPGAKKCPRDLEEMKRRSLSIPIEVSDKSLEELLLLADAALYFQTSMNVEFLAIGISKIIQVGTRVEPDLLVQKGWATAVATPEELMQALQAPAPLPSREELYDLAGFTPEWTHLLEKAIK